MNALVVAAVLAAQPVVVSHAQSRPEARARPLPSSVAEWRGLPGLGDGSELTIADERRLGDSIARQIYRDPDYLDDPVIGDYLQSIWRPLLNAARERG
ncbi:MAG: hypothetical protein R3E42_02730 [Burkholderiaceae bacterium]